MHVACNFDFMQQTDEITFIVNSEFNEVKVSNTEIPFQCAAVNAVHNV